MKLDGIHHISAMTGDAPRQPRLLHAGAGPAAGRQDGQPGRPERLPPLLRRRARHAGRRADVLRVPGPAPRPRRARGWCTASSRRSGPRRRSTSGRRASATRAWRVERVAAGALRFADPEGLGHELVVAGPRPAAARRAPGGPGRARAVGLRRACAPTRPRRSAAASCSRGSSAPSAPATASGSCAGRRRGGDDRAGTPRRRSGACRAPARSTTSRGAPPGRSTRRWRARLADAGVQVTPVIDRYYFHSIYFREPSGVLYEIADDGPGFTRDMPVEELGSRVILPRLARGAARGGGGAADAAARPPRGLACGRERPTDGWRYLATSARATPARTRAGPGAADAARHGRRRAGDARRSAARLLPGAPMLAPRGRVSEGGAARFFSRTPGGPVPLPRPPGAHRRARRLRAGGRRRPRPGGPAAGGRRLLERRERGGRPHAAPPRPARRRRAAAADAARAGARRAST